MQALREQALLRWNPFKTLTEEKVMDENALACSRCNYQADQKPEGWRKCGKCRMLWCPKCAPVFDRCANCVGGILVPLS